MSRFLAEAVVSCCGGLVECKGWEAERLSSHNPLIAYQYTLPTPRFARMVSVLVANVKGVAAGGDFKIRSLPLTRCIRFAGVHLVAELWLQIRE